MLLGLAWVPSPTEEVLAMDPILEDNEHTLVEAIVTIATAAQIIISKATIITVTTQDQKRYIKEFLKNSNFYFNLF